MKMAKKILANTATLKDGVSKSLHILSKGNTAATAKDKDMVYLFELDSVRNNEMEIQAGQKRFFETVTQEGKCVVLTFNQLTDSLAFLLPLKDNSKKVRNDYTKLILALCNNGSIKISRFRQTRTAAQYVLDSLAKAIDNKKISDSDFIFSSLPVKKGNSELLGKIKEALMYSDLSIIEDLVNLKNDETTAVTTLDSCGITDDNITLESLEYVLHYVEFILEISRQINAYLTPRKGKFPGFTEYMNYALTAKPCHLSLLDPDLMPLYKKAQILLNCIVNNEFKEQVPMDRTRWSIALTNRESDEKIKLMAAAIIDLCYLLTNQTSVSKLQISYERRDDFLCAFVPELQKLYRQYAEMTHKICTPANWNPNISTVISDWEYAVRITDAASEEAFNREYSWKTVLLFSQLRKLGQGISYFLLFILFDWISDFIENFIYFLIDLWTLHIVQGKPGFLAVAEVSWTENMSDYIGSGTELWEHFKLFLLITFLLAWIGLLFVFILSKMGCKISDLLESLKHVKTITSDLWRVITTKKHKQ